MGLPAVSACVSGGDLPAASHQHDVRREHGGACRFVLVLKSERPSRLTSSEQQKTRRSRRQVVAGRLAHSCSVRDAIHIDRNMASRYIKPRRRRRFTDKEQRFAVRRFTLAIIRVNTRLPL
jgi:hypothetical protein